MLRKVKLFRHKRKFMADDPRYRRYQIGRYTYGEPLIVGINDETTLKVGSFCSMAAGVTIFLGGDHRTDWITTYPFTVFFKEFESIRGHPYTKGDIIIGNDVWIGREAKILSGVMIGDGAAIGADAVVTKSVEPYTIIAGNPARVIKKRFSDKIIEKLLKIKWWEWDIDKIKENIPLMLSDDIEEFIKKNKNSG